MYFSPNNTLQVYFSSHPHSSGNNLSWFDNEKYNNLTTKPLPSSLNLNLFIFFLEITPVLSQKFLLTHLKPISLYKEAFSHKNTFMDLEPLGHEVSSNWGALSLLRSIPVILESLLLQFYFWNKRKKVNFVFTLSILSQDYEKYNYRKIYAWQSSSSMHGAC